ncbi:hypothetical protein VCRA2122O12_130026 [Vibrio crassostreae]|nr:hypothetical protein VCRA2110O1_130106 [Vibrio crassostreae]CAK1751357.1 hypothetical protein VCRA2114E5_130027 [Vibrio crassostreae]CAK1768336.1 hypothetical protein VCRA2110O4_140108 [Vibrio crassostreae]CAK2549635.1 hypothetical protein VCRA2110O2_120125 [Vibrio crassostreae]CAK2553083.1 hypothetical protein VCRA2110O3_130105 [Vibrio crassostreae]
MEVKRLDLEILKALTDSLHAMKLFHEILAHLIKMAFGYLLPEC